MAPRGWRRTGDSRQMNFHSRTAQQKDVLAFNCAIHQASRAAAGLRPENPGRRRRRRGNKGRTRAADLRAARGRALLIHTGRGRLGTAGYWRLPPRAAPRPGPGGGGGKKEAQESLGSARAALALSDIRILSGRGSVSSSKLLDL